MPRRAPDARTRRAPWRRKACTLGKINPLMGRHYVYEGTRGDPNMTDRNAQTFAAIALLLKGVMARINPNLWTGYI